MKILGPEKSLLQSIDEALIEGSKNQKQNGYPLRPSAAGYCSRKLAYDVSAFHGHMEKVEEVKKPNILRLLDLGHYIESHAISYIRKNTDWDVKYCQQSVILFKLASGRMIEGSIDLALVSKDNKYKAIADCKTVGNRWSSGFQSKWDEMNNKLERLPSVHKFADDAFYIDDIAAFFKEIGEDALQKNIMQINAYLHSGWAKEQGFQFGIVYQYLKDSSKHREIRFRPSQAVFDQLKTKYELVEKYGSKGKPESVPKDFPLGSFSCAYCPYAQQCWPGDRTSKAYWQTQPKKNWADKINDLEKGAELKELFLKREKLETDTNILPVIEQEIITAMINHEVRKIKLDDGQIFEVVLRKSPRERLVLVRSKE